MKRAAWLDHEIEWIEEPSVFELERLGLETAGAFILDKQVTVQLDYHGGGVITVRNIKIESMDHENKHLSYRVLGQANIIQGWDFGGTHLTPKEDQYGWELE
ncbi:MAG: hypothetical protein ACYSW6_08715, partial [Planctomycetota bacterium]|jgi:hypothetical protein